MSSGVAKTVCDISVIICTYTEKRWDDLIYAVESVKEQTQSPREIIVVVDNNPALLEMALQHLVDVVVVENTNAKGLSGARNSGIAVATSLFIAFLDDDAIASPDWLKLLREGFLYEEVLGVGGAIIPAWPDTKPRWLPEEFYWVVGCTYQGMPIAVSRIRNPIGANMCFRREIFETIGGFRDGIGRLGTLPMGCEETELCIRARQKWPQGDFLYLPDAIVSHSILANRITWRYFFARCFSEGLSKAIVTQSVGVKDSLASEWTYSLLTLPKGILKNLLAVSTHRDTMGLVKAFAIITGLSITSAGYCIGRLYSHMAVSKKRLFIKVYSDNNVETVSRSLLNSEV